MPIQQQFSEFYETWICKLEELLRLLLLHLCFHETKETENSQDLVNKVTTHYKEYYAVKFAATHENVLSMFSSFWATPFEKSHMWITGYKPSMFFSIIDSLIMENQPPLANSRGSFVDLSEEQLKKIEVLRSKIKDKESRVERQMERHGAAMTSPIMKELASIASNNSSNDDMRRAAMASPIMKELVSINNDENVDIRRTVDGLVQVSMIYITNELKKVMKMADGVRVKTLKSILNILSCEQSVTFLAALSVNEIQMRKLGKQWELMHR